MGEEILVLEARALNGIATLLIAPIIAYKIRQGNIIDRGKVLFGIGFLVYGLQILMRLWLPLSHPFIGTLAMIFLVTLAAAMGIYGGKLRPYTAGTIAALAVGVGGSFLVPQYRSYLFLASLLSYYGMMCYGGFSLSKKFGEMAYKFTLGWGLLLIVNTTFMLVESMEASIASDVLGTIAKLVILSGVMDRRFWGTTNMLSNLTKPVTEVERPRGDHYGSVTVLSSTNSKSYWEWVAKLVNFPQKYTRFFIGIFSTSLQGNDWVRKQVLSNSRVTCLMLSRSQVKIPNTICVYDLGDLVTMFSSCASLLAGNKRILNIVDFSSFLDATGEHSAILLIRDIASKISLAGGDLCIYVNPKTIGKDAKQQVERICDRYIDLDHEVPLVLQ